MAEAGKDESKGKPSKMVEKAQTKIDYVGGVIDSNALRAATAIHARKVDSSLTATKSTNKGSARMARVKSTR